MYSTSLPAVCFHKDMGWHFNFALRVHCSCSPAPQSGLSHSRLALSIMQYSGGCSNMQGRIQKISRHARHSHCVQECILSFHPASLSCQPEPSPHHRSRLLAGNVVFLLINTQFEHETESLASLISFLADVLFSLLLLWFPPSWLRDYTHSMTL